MALTYWHGCPRFPTDMGAVFNSFSKQSCLQTNCSLSPYLCPVGCFQEILFKQTRNCHWNQLDFSDVSASWAQESTSLLSQYRQWNSVKLCVFLVGCHPSDSDLAIQFVDWCKWLVYVASLLAHKPHLLLFFCIDWVGYCENLATVLFADLHWRTCFFLQEKPPTTTAPNPLWCCSNEGHGFFHSRKNYSKCLKNALAFSDQAHNLTSIFHTNAFSNMLLQGSSARVLQCSLLPSYTGAVFNSSGARLRELCQ